MTEICIVKTADGLRFEDGLDTARIVVSGADTGGKYALMELNVAPGQGQRVDGSWHYWPHLHRECEETFLVRSGTLEFLLDDKITTLRAGDFVRVPPGSRHGYANTSAEPTELLVAFYPAGLEELFVKYRTDGAGPAEGDGFVADATRMYASEFEDNG